MESIMSASASARGRSLRSGALVLAVAIALSGALALVSAPTAKAAFGSLSVEPGMYTGNPYLFVPTEDLRITIEADAGDVYDVQIVHWPWPFLPGDRVVYRTFENQTVLAGDVKTLTYTIPTNLPDDDYYFVSVHDQDWSESGNTGTTFSTWPAWWLTPGFRVQGYTFSVWTDRDAYLPGDAIVVSWLAQKLKDGAPALAGVGEMQMYDDSGNAIGTPYPSFFNSSQGSRTVRLGTSLPPDQNVNIYAWFNDTSGGSPARTGFASRHPYVGYLGLRVSTSSATYSPGSLVQVSISAKITSNPGNPFSWDEGAAGAFVNVTVVDLATAAPVSEYGATDLRSDAQGDLTHVFVLATSPTSATYEVQVHAETNGVQTADRTVTFDVDQMPVLDVLLTLDRMQYASGQVARATATVYREPAGTYTYTWFVTDWTTGNVLASLAGGASTYDYAIPSDFEGTLGFEVTVDDGEGNEDSSTLLVNVAFGFLSLTLSPTEYDAGRTLTVSYQLDSTVLTSPTYSYEVEDDGGNVVASGPASGGSVSYVVPNPARAWYRFTLTASPDGRPVTGTVTATRSAGFLLTTSLDRELYQPGETIRIRYTIAPRGTSALPAQFFFSVYLGGLFVNPIAQVATTSTSGEISAPLPAGTSEGSLFLAILEGSTGASSFQSVRVGTSNPLWDLEVGGVPAFVVLLTLLFVVLLGAVFLLWRRTAAGGVP